MLDKNNFVKAGKLSKLYSYKGAFVAELSFPLPDTYYNQEGTMLIDINNCLVPFFIDYISEDELSPTIHFDTINSREKARELLNLDIYIASEYFENKIVTNPDSLEGYIIKDMTSGKSGTIKDFEDIKMNPLLEVEIDDKIISLPCHENFLRDLDRENKILYVEYPEDLITDLMN